MEQSKYLLDEDNIPTHGYNILSDMPEPMALFMTKSGKQRSARK